MRLQVAFIRFVLRILPVDGSFSLVRDFTLDSFADHRCRCRGDVDLSCEVT